jgi:hypothetical protein
MASGRVVHRFTRFVQGLHAGALRGGPGRRGMDDIKLGGAEIFRTRLISIAKMHACPGRRLTILAVMSLGDVRRAGVRVCFRRWSDHLDRLGDRAQTRRLPG